MAIPTSTSSTITINEDTPRILLISDFPFADADPLDVLVKVKITTLPTVGTLKLSGVDVTLNQEVLATAIAANNLIYLPAVNANGASYATIGFMVSDGTNYSTPANTITVNVTAVNDAPVDTNFSINVTQNITYNGILPIGSDVENDTLTYAKVASPVFGTATVNANGTFTYAPSINYVGSDTFTYSVSDGLLSNTYTVSVNVISVIATISISTVTNATSVNKDTGISNGTGIFDVLMNAINIQTIAEWEANRLKGTDYANVKMGAMTEAIKQSIMFALQKPISEKQTDSEVAKKLLIERQTKGFDDDAKQKLLKQALDSWSVAYSVAKDANSIPDAIKVNPIDSIMKNAMDSLNVVKSNNPLAEA